MWSAFCQCLMVNSLEISCPSYLHSSELQEVVVQTVYTATHTKGCCSLCAGEDDLVEITDQLMELNKFQIYNLGLVLGLAHRRVVDLRENSSTNLAFLDAVVLHWLQRVDRVKEVSWEALVKALRHQRLGQTGIATSIAEKYGTTHSSLPTYSHSLFLM